MIRPLSPETLVYGLVTAANPQVSPDGTQILYTHSSADPATKKAGSQLWACAIDGSAPRQLTWSGARNGGGQWSPDGTQIAFVSDRVAKNGIFVLPVTGPAEAREITRHGKGIEDLAWSPDGTLLAYVTLVDPENPEDEEPPEDTAPRVRVTRRIDYKQDNRGYLNDARLQVFVVDVATGERRQVTTTLRDHTSPRWSPDGRTLAARQANHNGMQSQLALVDVASGETRLIGPENGTIGHWAWSPQGDRIICAADPDHSHQLDYFICEVTTGELRRLTEDLQAAPDAGFPTVQPPAHPVWLDERRVLFHALRAGASQLAIVDSATGEVEVIQEWPAIHVGQSVDAGRRYVVQGHASLEAVGEIAIYDLVEGRTVAVTTLNAEALQEAPTARWEQLSVQRGGLTIDAWLLLPPEFDPSRRYPLVLDVHGGPHGLYGYGFNVIQQCLATNGFLVVFANPRGSASYGRHFVQQVVRDWGGEDYLDLQAVVDLVAQRAYVDSRRIGIWGYSYGGYMTAWTIGQTDRFRAAVCGAPCFDLESMYGTSDISHTFGEIEWGGAPHQRREWYAERSPSSFAHQAQTPTLIIHGEADERCPIGQGEQMFIALLKAGCEVEFARYPGGSHLFLRVGPPEHRLDVLTRILGWFRAHLGEPS